MDDAAFATFVEKEILWMETAPTFYDVYGLGRKSAYSAFSIGGKADMSKESGGRSTFKAPRGGNILDARENRLCTEISVDVGKQNYELQRLLEPCVELHDVVDAAGAPSANAASFAKTLWQLVDKHIADSHKQSGLAYDTSGVQYSYENFEVRGRTPICAGRFPAYKRVQMLHLYQGFLSKLGELPANDRLPKNAADVLRRLADLAAPVRVNGIPDELAWVCILDQRVEKRNSDCAHFLASIPQSFGSTLRTTISEASRLNVFSFWRAEFAGSLQFTPGHADQCIPHVLDVKPDHPLYVLRNGKNGSPVLRKLLVPRSDGLKWLFASGRDKDGEWFPGEPLFQVRDGKGALVDAGEAVNNILSTLPQSAVAEFKSKSFWIELQ